MYVLVHQMKHALRTALRSGYGYARKLLVERPPPPPAKELSAHDEFLVWMRYINPGMLSQGNIELFAHCIENLPNGAPVVEIGSFAGLSLNHIIYFLRRSRRANPVFSVDAWGTYEAGNIPNSEVPFDKYRDHVVETFKRNVVLFSGTDRLPHHIELTSDAFFRAWHAGEERTDYFGRRISLGGPISFAYIDGDHTYEQSMKDFENVDRYLQVGGFIVFDDSSDYSDWGSNRTAKEAARLPQYELTARNPNYCIRKIA